MAIAIVDDKKHLGNMLRDKLCEKNKYEILFTAENGKDCLKKMKNARKCISPDIALMDIDMPVMDGVEAVRQGKTRYSQKNYLLTIFEEDEKIFNAIRAGASGYMLKDEPTIHCQPVYGQLQAKQP